MGSVIGQYIIIWKRTGKAMGIVNNHSFWRKLIKTRRQKDLTGKRSVSALRGWDEATTTKAAASY